MNPLTLLNSVPGALAQGLIWGIMAIGVAITYKILDYADLTVDNSLCTGRRRCRRVHHRRHEPPAGTALRGAGRGA